ncbi:MAG TPA: hypothetical protein H9867_06465 [Candidatus Corynebacterium gallistercoris]|uniref:PEP-CTERM protein-sorting domain-containing protein n=1 Tax=Candidatus Corynebacterium gallistercoris TaxID=2838530 RepID=A0A9D1RYI4_9CORY|nr:hypothetical protein [Candidatus Corynebacterium gallistercoris]
MDSDSRRKKLVWESLLGFVGFFTVLAGIQAVWNVFQPNPAVGPALLFLALLLATWGAWRGYRRHR